MQLIESESLPGNKNFAGPKQPQPQFPRTGFARGRFVGEQRELSGISPFGEFGFEGGIVQVGIQRIAIADFRFAGRRPGYDETQCVPDDVEIKRLRRIVSFDAAAIVRHGKFYRVDYQSEYRSHFDPGGGWLRAA